MPIVYTIDPERRLVEARMSGAVTPQEVREYEEQLLADPDYRWEYDTLTDLRDTPTVFTREQIQDVAVRKKDRLPALAGTRRAIVASSDGAFGMMRMLEALTGGDESPFRVFRTMEEARRWLGR